jgi:hypothetical protein
VILRKTARRSFGGLLFLKQNRSEYCDVRIDADTLSPLLEVRGDLNDILAIDGDIDGNDAEDSGILDGEAFHDDSKPSMASVVLDLLVG